MMRMDQQLSPDQKRDIADRTGPLLADAYEKQPKPDVNKMSLLFQSALASARASVTGQAANPPPAAPAQPAQANAQDTPAAKPAENPKSPPPQQDDRKSRADKAAADRAQKAKQAADRIRGLIGR